MIKCEKIFSSLYKETQGMQRLDYHPLHQDDLPTQIHQRKNCIVLLYWGLTPL